MPSTDNFNLREWACIAQGGHRSGGQVKGCQRVNSQRQEGWLEYQCVGCGVWFKDVNTYRYVEYAD